MQNCQRNRDACHITRTILVVEDDVVLGRLLTEALQDDLPCQIHLVTSAEMAIEILQMITPSLFMLDYLLPKMNGLELADYLQCQVEMEHIPIILMSAQFPQRMSPKKPIRCVQKPFDLEKFLQLTTELLLLSSSP